MINPYHVHVRRKTAMDTKHFVRMSLQLYQVDYKSFLLDFKSLPVTEDENRSSEELSGNCTVTVGKGHYGMRGTSEGHKKVMIWA